MYHLNYVLFSGCRGRQHQMYEYSKPLVFSSAGPTACNSRKYSRKEITILHFVIFDHLLLQPSARMGRPWRPQRKPPGRRWKTCRSWPAGASWWGKKMLNRIWLEHVWISFWNGDEPIIPEKAFSARVFLRNFPLNESKFMHCEKKILGLACTSISVISSKK